MVSYKWGIYGVGLAISILYIHQQIYLALRHLFYQYSFFLSPRSSRSHPALPLYPDKHQQMEGSQKYPWYVLPVAVNLQI